MSFVERELRTFVSLSALMIAACTQQAVDPDKNDGAPPRDGSGEDGGANGNDGGNGGGGGSDDGHDIHEKTFHTITLTDESERVTGVICSASDACAVSTGRLATLGHIYATNGTAITDTLVTGDDAYTLKWGDVNTQSGTPFWGFSKVGDRFIARHGTGEKIFTSATGDVSQAASWTTQKVGIPTGASDFGLNKQHGFGFYGEHWVLVSNYRIWQSSDYPGPDAAWTEIYAPNGTPTVPPDLAQRRIDDKTLCNSDPAGTAELTQLISIAGDGNLIVMPASTASQRGNDAPGVCISNDHGLNFHRVYFPERVDEDGPLGVVCTSRDHCIAYAGKDIGVSNPAIYVSNDVSKGKDSTWTKATTPTLADYTTFRHAAFAADGKHGWIVGWPRDARPLLYATSDGGTTWTDATSKIRALAPDVRLHTVYVHGSRTFVGGDKTLLATD
jgi:hypothetical protein